MIRSSWPTQVMRIIIAGSSLKLDSKGDPRFFLAGNDGCSRTGKWLVDGLSGTRFSDDWAVHAFDGFLRAVHRFCILIAVFNRPEGALLPVAVPMPSTTDRVPAWLVLPGVMPAAHHERGLRPDDLAADLESARFQAVRDCGSVKSAVPDVCNVAGKQRPRLAPVGSVVVADLAMRFELFKSARLRHSGSY